MLGGRCSHTTFPSASNSTIRLGPLPYSANMIGCLTVSSAFASPPAAKKTPKPIAQVMRFMNHSLPLDGVRKIASLRLQDTHGSTAFQPTNRPRQGVIHEPHDLCDWLGR